LKYATPESTIDALKHSVRARGVNALREPLNAERVSQLDDNAKQQIKDWIKVWTKT